jgi:MoaA/NifB/PqqE/SkfB family radical SAM enzyme
MKTQRYQAFSLLAHEARGAAKGLSGAQFELTFGCDLHCRHCMTDCYNRPEMLKRELTTAQVQSLLDALKAAGVLWLCLTGGDPLTRPDFPKIYKHAKKLGFIVTVFTSGYRIDRAMARLLASMPPFGIEITLNAVSQDLYERISGFPGSFCKVMTGIGLLKAAGLPLKLKTQVTLDNFSNVPLIRAFARRQRIPWESGHVLYPRLDGDLSPTSLRLHPRQVIGPGRAARKCAPGKERRKLFPCVIDSGQEMGIDPWGYSFLCSLMRKPRYDLRRTSITLARRLALKQVKTARFKSDSRCRSCGVKQDCPWCPGFAFLEVGDREKPVEYCCQIARGLARAQIKQVAKG